jgi:hypothetical protein
VNKIIDSKNKFRKYDRRIKSLFYDADIGEEMHRRLEAIKEFSL